MHVYIPNAIMTMEDFLQKFAKSQLHLCMLLGIYESMFLLIVKSYLLHIHTCMYALNTVQGA